MGQSNKLHEQGELPLIQVDGDPKKRQRLIDNLQSTVGVVLQYRRFFKETFKDVGAYTNRVDLVPYEQRSEILGAMATDIICWGASDSIYMAFSLAHTRHPAAAAGDLYRVFLTAASTWLIALAADHPIRGGIDVGLGMEIEPGEIYGQALEAAYHLESRVAEWPRVVVGQDCLRYLDTVKRYRGVNERWSWAANVADMCLSMLQRHDDGTINIDGLGGTMLEQNRELPTVRKLVLQAHENVRANYQRYADDKKLGPRYKTLLAYFDKCAPKWRSKGE